MAKKKSALDIDYVLSDELSEFIGSETATRAEVTKAVWEYIKANDLQDSKDRRTIVPDEELAVLTGKGKFNMMKLAGKLNKHFVERV